MTEKPKTPQEVASGDIHAIRRFLTAIFPRTTYVANKDKSVTHEGAIDPERLNHSKVTIDGRPYNLSITASWLTSEIDPNTPRVEREVVSKALGDWQEINWYEDEDFKAAWERMKTRGFQWSSNNIEKAHLGWLMHKHSDKPALLEAPWVKEAVLARPVVQDYWNPDPEDPFWMLTAPDGSWLKNVHSCLTTRNAVKAVRYPSEWHADVAARGLHGTNWMKFKATEHTWSTVETQVD